MLKTPFRSKPSTVVPSTFSHVVTCIVRVHQDIFIALVLDLTAAATPGRNTSTAYVAYGMNM